MSGARPEPAPPQDRGFLFRQFDGSWRRAAALRGLAAALALVGFLAGAGPALAAVDYETDFAGVDSDALKKELKASSQLVARQDDGADNEAALRRRAVADLERLQAVTNAAGYYDAKLSYRIDTQPKTWRVTVEIDLGEPYRLEEVRLVGPEGATPPLINEFKPADFGLEIGARATSAAVVDAEAKILRFYTERGWPLAKMVGREAIIDRADHSMHVTYTIAVGPAATFGDLDISGLERVDRAYVDRKLTWHEGDLYDSAKVEAVRQSLVDSNLFSTVKLVPAEAVAPDGRIPLRLEVTERPPRSVGAGALYDSSLGFGVRAFWEHRNLFGEGELLRFEATLGESQNGGLLRFVRPDFLIPKLDSRSELSVGNEIFDAYDARREKAFTGLDYRIAPTVTGGAGVQVEQAEVSDDTGTRDYTLFGLPLFIRRDDTDSLLNPTRGSRLGFTTTPYTSVGGTPLTFASSKASASGYQKLGSTDRFVLAGFGNLGSVVGVSLNDLPRDKRLYAGGGGSIRGYAFEHAGPLDAEGKPLGGLSSLELGLELRTKITETIGIANFIEGGNVYDRSVPQFDKRLFWGTGIGLRYYSPIGPVRFDIATPLERRSSDGVVQIYISLGQAF